ncbi:MAG TPA: sigma-70 family RNA polymerase sigma factor [Actinomycetota bacterium]|jgi:RNA polymerase sigma-70 factor (ECF subfamily)
MWSLSDETLLAGLGSGDSDAAAAFIRRFQGRVYGLAHTIVGDAMTAEEVAQETFTRAWRHAHAYDPRRARVSTWLLSIARNIAIDQIRMRRHEPVDPETFFSLEIASDDASPDERAIADDNADRLRAGLKELPVEQRRALVLAAFYGRTGREISELEGVPLGTVKTRIRTAMLKLRSILEARDER